MAKPIGQHADGSACWTKSCKKALRIEAVQLATDFMLVKYCPGCQKSLSLDQFGKNKSKPDGLQIRCRECRKEPNRIFYEATKEKHSAVRKAANAAGIAINRAYVLNYKQAHPCVDCSNEMVEVLDFDHKDASIKLFDIGPRSGTNVSLEKLKAEIAKCEMRCANCHRIRTYGNKTWRTGHRADTSNYTRISRNSQIVREKKRNLVLARFIAGCIDCKNTDPRVLEMDHVRGQKVSNISDMIREGSSMSKFEEELAKCDVRCANCHRIVTRSREREQKNLSL